MVRVRTGIPGLDQMLRGGFLEGDAVMVAGGTGTGKTTFALQCLVNGIIESHEKGIYVTFEELPEQIYRDAQSFGWDLRRLEDEDKFRLICTSPNLLLESEEGEHILDEPIKEIQPRRIAIDPLNHLEMFIEKRDIRRETYRLVRFLKTKGLSSLFTWESPQRSDGLFSATDAGLSYLVDCVILLRFVEIESSLRKALTILKMRGSDHEKQLREYEVTAQGIKVVAPFSGYESVLTGSARKPFTEEAARVWSRVLGGKS